MTMNLVAYSYIEMIKMCILKYFALDLRMYARFSVKENDPGLFPIRIPGFFLSFSK